MIDNRADGGEAEVPKGQRRWMPYGVLGATCALVIGVYAYTAHSGYLVSSSLDPADAYYNLLVQGFRAGQLNVKREVPPGFAQLHDPYDRGANAPYGLLDLSYYKGKFYLYFGVTPAVVLFWPYAALTGHYLLQKDAAVIFCVVGFLASVGLLCALWRRYFAGVSVGVVALCVLGLGLAPFTPLLLARCDVYEVSISCGYAMTMLALAAMWKALHAPRQRGWWLAAASLVYGLAVGARPSLLPGAVILLVPVAQAWRERRRVWVALIAATVPLALVGLGLMLYNAWRFDNPFEFGWRYQLAGDRQSAVQQFSLGYLWFNFRVYFLEPARWSARFPFVHDIAEPPLPAGHGRVEHPFGVLSNIPLVWLALAVALCWRNGSGQARSRLGWFVSAVALLFGACALTMGLFFSVCVRYEMEFLSTLVLLAVMGILGVERALAPASGSGPTGRAVWRRVVRWGWGLLLGFSVAFSLLASVSRCAEANNAFGIALAQAGRLREAVVRYEQAVRLRPDFPEAHNNLGSALLGLGKVQAAIGQYEQALRLNPEFAEAHNDLGLAVVQQGRMQEAMGHWEQALRIRPDYAEAHYNWGVALARLGDVSGAIGHYEQALRLNPDHAEAHNSLGLAVVQLGRIQEAVWHWEQALRIRPDYAEAHYNCGVALARLGRTQEAVWHWEQALRIRPNYAEAHYNLGVASEQTGKIEDAIRHYEQALQFKPNLAEAQDRLARLRTEGNSRMIR